MNDLPPTSHEYAMMLEATGREAGAKITENTLRFLEEMLPDLPPLRPLGWRDYAGLAVIQARTAATAIEQGAYGAAVPFLQDALNFAQKARDGQKADEQASPGEQAERADTGLGSRPLGASYPPPSDWATREVKPV